MIVVYMLYILNVNLYCLFSPCMFVFVLCKLFCNIAFEKFYTGWWDDGGAKQRPDFNCINICGNK